MQVGSRLEDGPKLKDLFAISRLISADGLFDQSFLSAAGELGLADAVGQPDGHGGTNVLQKQTWRASSQTTSVPYSRPRRGLSSRITLTGDEPPSSVCSPYARPLHREVLRCRSRCPKG